jgi:cytochrome bd ubiquinol oxidase subunit II
VSGADWVWYTMGAALVVYVVSGGADFGAGAWYLLASGPRRAAQRTLIENAIAPIWEANHVWLIFIIVLMFTAFPPAFAAIGTALHIPIAFALIGIVLRGAAFVFRAYGLHHEHIRRRSGRAFAGASVFTPVFLGLIVGALASGEIRVHDGRVTSGFFAGWLTPFAWSTGLLTLTLFALVAAVYLTVESDTEDLARDFARRATVAQLLAAVLGATTLWLASSAPDSWQSNLTASVLGKTIMAFAVVAALATLLALSRRHYKLARAAVIAQAALVVSGWGVGMNEHLVLSDITTSNALRHAEVLRPLLIVVVLGVAVLAPSLAYLFRVFKRV